MRAAALVLICGASCVRADVAYWFWMASDTGDGNGIVTPGESALLTLWLGFDPRQDGNGNFREAGPYTITGDDQSWQKGTIESYSNLLDGYGTYDDGTLDASDNSISGIQHFQFGPFYSMGDERNPIPLYSIRWKPDDYRSRRVLLDNGGPDALIWVGTQGESRLYPGAGGGGAFQILSPSPATPLLALAAMGWAARRRR